jgi:YbbR domain-containing protein
MPEGFSNSRITIDPASIDIAGDKDTVSQYQTITLPTVIDFSNVNPTNNVFQMTIPMPSGVKNVSNVNQAEVTVNLSGYTQSTVTTQTFKFENTPSDETITVDTKSLPVVIVGSEAQVAKLTDSSIYASIDLKSYSNKTGSFEVPVTIGISGATNCWAYGEYTANITITAASETATGEESGATSNGVS